MARSARSYQREADELRAGGWTYRQIASRWQQRYGFNPRVAFRLAHGLTQADVAQRWNEQWPDADAPKTAKQISYWEIWPGPAGRAPSLDTLNKLAFLYRCTAGELLGGEDHSHLDTAGLRATETATHVDPPSNDVALLRAGAILTRVTDRVVEDFEILTDTYRRLDYREGSGRVSADVGAHLRRMLEVSNRTTSTSTHRRLLRAAGDAAQLAAWLAIDAQRYQQAHGYCRLTVSLAEKANDRALHSYGLGVLSQIHLHGGDGRIALSVLGTARDVAGQGAPAAVNSWLGEATGEAYGFIQEPRRGMSALAEAERTFDGVNTDNTPVWLSFFNADCHAARLKGRCLTRLDRPKEATRSLYEALTLLPAVFVRERSGALIDLAMAYTQMNQIEQACHAAAQADVLARQTGSERNRKRLRQLLIDLLPWTGLNCVKSLYRQVLIN
jgi:transcriptional regulator with XRE-family HTH domain